MPSFEIELDTYETGETVIAEVEFEHTEDCDWCPHGEHGSWVDTSFREIKRVKYTLNGQKYEPTKDDMRFWDNQIERQMNEECA